MFSILKKPGARLAVAGMVVGTMVAAVGGAYANERKVAATDGQVNACINKTTKVIRLETPEASPAP